MQRSNVVVNRLVMLLGMSILASPTLGIDKSTLNVGDTVKLAQRDNDIPGHPGDGDQHLSVRLKAESQAEVLEIGNWVKVKGTSNNGTSGTAWIVAKYIDSIVSPGAIDNPPSNGGGSNNNADSSSHDWCPAKGSSSPHPSGRLRIATWNIENLHAQDGGQVYPNSSVKRYPIDYERIKCYTRLIDADIVAVQEIDGEEALRRVFDNDVYDFHMSSRNTSQDTGFAYKKGLTVTERPDYTALDVGGVRRGCRIDVTHNGKTIRLMSVHLKSGCFSNNHSGSACNKLKQQVPKLEEWIDTSANEDDGLIVLGDFNRRLTIPGDTIWSDIDDGDPPNADLYAVTENMPISCRDNQYTEFIDHIVLDKRAAEWLDHSSFRHVTYRQQDRPNWNSISDHCPVVVELWVD